MSNIKTSIICRVKKVVYHNKDNGYSVLSVISDTEDGPFSVCGTLKGMPEGSVLRCQGIWKDHVVYGRQFMVESWEEGKADEVKTLICSRTRTNCRPVYGTWGNMLRHNPDIAEKVKYVTEVFLTEVEKEYDDADYNYRDSCIEVSATAHVKAVYYAVYNGQKYSLITCSFTTYGSHTIDDLDDDDVYNIEILDDWDIVERHARKSSVFFGIEDFYGLCDLDFHASGVPTCEDKMREKHYKAHPHDQEDYTIEDMEYDLESALEKAFSDAGIEYEDGEYQCSRMFSRSKISGEFC